MTAWAYYNEWDEPTAAWLRELIARGLVAPGEVDTRSITEVSPDDLRGFTQAHFFAGIGGWSHALRLAGWPDDRPVWTGSPPCQPFSVAGKRDGYADERHLAPAWLDLVKVGAPERLFGEQVSGAISKGWLDALQHELEAENYACGAVVLASCGVGAPNIRSRLYFAAERLDDAAGARHEPARRWQPGEPEGGKRLLGLGRDADGLEGETAGSGLLRCGDDGGVADADQGQRGRLAAGEGRQRDGAAPGREQGDGGARRGLAGAGAGDGQSGRGVPELGCDAHGMANAGCERRQQDTGGASGDETPDGRAGRLGGAAHGDHVFASSVTDGRPGPTNGFWRAADWLACRDGAWRPVEPGAEPLADGVSARVVRLRGYGNAINPIAAAAFIEAATE